jgi:quinol monooxygenase YgiN
MSHAGISFEADMTAEQAAALAELMEEGRPTRPEGVVTALLEYADGRGRLLAVWRDAETLDRYLAEAEVPRGVELMRKIGLEPEIRRFEVLDLG